MTMCECIDGDEKGLRKATFLTNATKDLRRNRIWPKTISRKQRTQRRTTMKPRNILAGLFICALGAGIPTQLTLAAVVDIDWQAPGDAKLMLDTDTGMQWLDLSVTANQTFNGVVAKLAPGQTYAGFRVATQVEVLTLWSHAGITNYEREWTIGQYPAVSDMVQKLGPTTMIEPGLFTVATHTIGMVDGGPALDGSRRWATELTYAPDGVSTRTSVNYYTWDVATADMHYSTWLVRPVPLPGTFWLLMTGIIGISGCCRRAHASWESGVQISKR